MIHQGARTVGRIKLYHQIDLYIFPFHLGGFSNGTLEMRNEKNVHSNNGGWREDNKWKSISKKYSSILDSLEVSHWSV